MKRTAKRIAMPVMDAPALERLRNDLVKYMETSDLKGAVNSVLNNRELCSYLETNLPENHGLEMGITRNFSGSIWEKIWTNWHYGLTRSLANSKKLAIFRYSSKSTFMATEEFSDYLYHTQIHTDEFCYNLVDHALKRPQRSLIDLGDFINPYTGKPLREKVVKVSA